MRVILGDCADGDCIRVYRRVARDDEYYYHDLGSSVVRIGPHGYEVLSQSPVPFLRPDSLAVLPRPCTPGAGTLDILDKILSLSVEDLAIVKAFLLGAMRPSGPYPALAFTGPPGSTKSTQAGIIQGIIDPHLDPDTRRARIYAPPETPEVLYLLGMQQHLLALDNMSTISPTMSDAYCRVLTGGTLSRRKHYSDTDTVSVSLMRPMIMTGLADYVRRSDLRSRCLIVEAQRPDAMLPEDAILRKSRYHLPIILGGLYDLVAKAIRDSGEYSGNSRLSDFAAWVGGANPDWHTAIENNQEQSAQTATDDSFHDLLRGIANDSALATRMWKAGALQQRLIAQGTPWADEISPAEIGYRLAEAAADLRSEGIRIEKDRRKRAWRITCVK